MKNQPKVNAHTFNSELSPSLSLSYPDQLNNRKAAALFF